MPENEAIKILDTEKHCLKNSTRGLCKINCGECKENIPIAYQEKTYEVAIYALKEIQQYRKSEPWKSAGKRWRSRSRKYQTMRVMDMQMAIWSMTHGFVRTAVRNMK